MSTELDALMLANALEVSDKHPELINVNNRAAAELRRLHAENKRLETLCYDYLGELTAMRAVEHMRKQRKPLTDEEMKRVCAEAFSYDPYAIARAIERAHGIGGEA
jgi:hypothetical protein